MNRENISRQELLRALNQKAIDRDSLAYVENHKQHLKDIAESPDIDVIWSVYSKKYPYAKGIALPSILELILWAFEQDE
ncbi:MAG: hypothetical protein LBT26_05305 [Clostridiales Family XIII bacterium]|jgi:hypothetical protein|nr:hypothetical protein [Clostridiales Family XIII bacterium]